MLPIGLLSPLPIPQQVWEDISLDFVDGSPKAEGKYIILVVGDRLTKYTHFIPMPHPYTTQQSAKLFYDKVFKLHELPKSIVSDRDTIIFSFGKNFSNYKNKDEPKFGKSPTNR